MKKLFEQILKHKAVVIAIFAAACVVSIIMGTKVKINYNLVDYLPDDAASTKALNLMEEEFEGGVPNARMMVEDISIPEALELKEDLKKVDGIKDVTWMDDAININIPLEMIDQDILNDYYKDNTALFTLTVDDKKIIEALDGAKQLTNKTISLTGAAQNQAVAMRKTEEEIQRIILFIVPLCFAILLLTTTSWFEPVLFMITIGVAILLNRGTNLIFGEISFVTNAAGSILQLAVSMDYSIFLLHRFADYRKKGMNVHDAMLEALQKAFRSITASGLTTVIGFAALILMRFKIGPDMGYVMAKAIVFSMISVLVFLPVVAIMCYKWIDRTQHRPLYPEFRHFADFVQKIKKPAIVLFCIVVIPSVTAQSQNKFLYGTSRIFGEGTEAYEETQRVESKFGKSNQFVLMVPKGDFATEKKLSDELHNIPQITSIISYVDNAGAEVPIEYLDEEVRLKLLSDHYSRMVLNVQTDYESKTAFDVVEQIRAIAKSYYPDYYLAGESVNTYDIKEVVTADMAKVNAIAIIAVFVVIMFSMKSVIIPIILVFVIEASIWINLSIPYFLDDSLFYIGYLIISSIQLGATVDYAILLASRYLEERKVKSKEEALRQTMMHTTLSILTSASILTLSGAMLAIVSTHGVISELGSLIGKGAALSLLLVLLVLPGLLYYFDEIIQRTIWKSRK
ncbi:MAG: MMPL family transporter [Clostridiales bacterium]|nr:MMPL family transporter [Clostridiales bacterium]